jgi:uncharacterized protein YegP (UPF0339 family)
VTKPYFEIFRTADGQWAWQLVKGRHVTAIAPDAYSRKASAIRGAERLMALMKGVDRKVREVDLVAA